MKKRPILGTLAATTAALALAAPVYQLLAQESAKPKAQNSGKIEIEIDPGAPGFSAADIERNIRQMAKGMDLNDQQRQDLEDALSQLRDSVKPGADGKPGKFKWKWEFQNDGASPAKPKAGRIEEASPDKNSNNKDEEPAPGQDRGGRARQMLERLQKQFQNGGGGGLQGQDLQDMMKEMLGEDFNPQKLLEEMMKQMGADDNGGRPFRWQDESPDGSKRFFFRFGPQLGDENEDGNAEENRGNLWQQFENLRDNGAGLFNPDRAPRDSKYSRASLAEFRPAVKEARHSTVSVLREGRQIALGTIATANGYILTKASELGRAGGRNGDKIECEFMDGTILPGKRVTALDAYDLALIKVEARDLKPAVFKAGDLPIGTLLAAADIDEDPISVGVVSVQARNLDDGQKGFLGLSMDDAPDGVLIRGIVEGGPAQKAELKVGDVVLAVDGQAVKHPHEVQKKVGSMHPGDVVKLRIKDGAAEEEVSVELSSRKQFGQVFNPGVDPTARMGSALSGTSSGFPNAIQNDLGINANQCGGPVADVEGNLVGINIARSGRTSTFMIPAKTVNELLADVQNGKFTYAKDSSSLKQDVKQYEAELKKAEDAYKATHERLKAAREALEKSSGK